MRKTAAVVILLFLWFFPITSQAQITEKSFSLSPMIGGYTFDGGQNLETSPVYGIRAGYSLTRYWGLEAVFDYVNTDVKHSDGSVDFYRYGLDVLWHFTPERKLVPYLAAGLGGMQLNGPKGLDNADGSFAAVNVGAGIKYFLTDSLALRADVRDIMKFNDIQNNLEYTVGLVFYFGGEKPTVAQAQPPEKEKAPVTEAAPAPPAQAPVPPPPPKPEVVEKVVEFNMLPVFFDFNKYNIRPDAERTLQRNLKWFELNPGKKVRIEATCDMRGSVAYNKRLAQKRADAVKNWLIKHGIDGKLLIATIIGKVDAFSSATTEEGYQMNRRVQFVPAR